MKFEEKERIEELKRKMIRDQGFRCYVCGREFNSGNLPEMAHRICKAKYLIRKYGKAVIHHEMNLRITCPGSCNSKVMINPESLEAKELIEQIREALKSEQ